MKPFSGSAFLGGLVLTAVISVPSAQADKARVLKATANRHRQPPTRKKGRAPGLIVLDCFDLRRESAPSYKS
jgi:hypothetical protein